MELVGLKNTSIRKDWEERLSKTDDKKVKFLHAVNGDISDLAVRIYRIKTKYSSEVQNLLQGNPLNKY